jgi:hypothetical protein
MSFALALGLLSSLAAVAWGWAAAATRARRRDQERTENFIRSLRTGNTDRLSYRR